MMVESRPSQTDMTPSFPGGKSGCGHGAGMEGGGLVGPRVPGYWEQTADSPSERGREGKAGSTKPRAVSIVPVTSPIMQ